MGTYEFCVSSIVLVVALMGISVPAVQLEINIKLPQYSYYPGIRHGNASLPSQPFLPTSPQSDTIRTLSYYGYILWSKSFHVSIQAQSPFTYTSTRD